MLISDILISEERKARSSGLLVKATFIKRILHDSKWLKFLKLEYLLDFQSSCHAEGIAIISHGIKVLLDDPGQEEFVFSTCNRLYELIESPQDSQKQGVFGIA